MKRRAKADTRVNEQGARRHRAAQRGRCGERVHVAARGRPQPNSKPRAPPAPHVQLSVTVHMLKLDCAIDKYANAYVCIDVLLMIMSALTCTAADNS